jgi:hypothetical protein
MSADQAVFPALQRIQRSAASGTAGDLQAVGQETAIFTAATEMRRQLQSLEDHNGRHLHCLPQGDGPAVGLFVGKERLAQAGFPILQDEFSEQVSRIAKEKPPSPAEAGEGFSHRSTADVGRSWEPSGSRSPRGTSLRPPRLARHPNPRLAKLRVMLKHASNRLAERRFEVPGVQMTADRAYGALGHIVRY